MDHKTGILGYLIIGALFLVIGLLLAPKVIGNEETNELFVNGYAKVNVLPKDVKVFLNLENKSDNSDIALNKNLETLSLLNKYYEELNKDFNDLKLETLSFNVVPYYEYNKELTKNELLGYKATHNLVFSIKDFEEKEILIDFLGKVLEFNGVSIANLSFEVSEDQKELIRKQLLADAMEDSWEKARVLGNTGFFVLEKVPKSVTINYNDYPIYYKSYDSAYGLEQEMLNTRITPEEQEISASVNVIYKYN